MNKVIILGSEGLIGKTLFNYLSDKKFKIIGVDKNLDSNKQNKNNHIFDISSLENQEDFDCFLSDLVGHDNADYLTIIDALLIRKKIEKNSKQETHSAFLGYLTTTITIAKWFGNFCKKKNINGNMIMISSVKGFYAPKFKHYENLNMNSDVEYGISKAGISYAAKDLSVRFKGIARYNCLAPGGIKGEDHSSTFIKRYDDSCLKVPGLVDPLEVAKIIKILISESSPIIGQTIIVDNGWSLT